MKVLKQAILVKEKSNSTELTESDFHKIQNDTLIKRKKTKQNKQDPDSCSDHILNNDSLDGDFNGAMKWQVDV